MPAVQSIMTLPFAGLRCPKCQYDLSGLATPQCPECGTTFTPELIRRAERNARRRKWLVAALVMFVVMYAPYCWLLFMDYPWSDYRWSWIMMWPGLPVLVPAHAMGRWLSFAELNSPAGVVLLDALGIVLWLMLTWIASRGRKRLIVIAVVVLLLSWLNSWGLYHAFLM